MIDPKLRGKGIGGSEVAAILGMDARRDAFAVYADKLGLLQRAAPTGRMLWGKRIERVIADAYSDETGRPHQWCDETRVSPARSWQVYSPDAFVIDLSEGRLPMTVGGLDAKNVAWDQSATWGEPGTDVVPDSIALQCQWYCSAAELPWWDVAALFGGNDLRIYRVNRDAEIEAVLLEETERFWRDHVLAHVPPSPGSSTATTEALKKMYPRNVEACRFATPEEGEILARLKAAREASDAADAEKEAAENAIKLAIGESEGLIHGPIKVTWKKTADTFGPAWEEIARDLGATPAVIAAHTKMVRAGARRLHCKF